MSIDKMIKNTVLITLLFSLLLTPAARAHEDEPHHPMSIPELEEGLLELMWETNIPGLSVAVVENGELTWTAGLGLLDRDAGTRAAPDSVFRVGSVSKSFVSIAVLMLVEQGLLNLDDRLADLAPEIEFSNPWEDTHPVRLIHLLEHTTGFGDIHLRELAYQDPDISLLEGLAFNPASRISRWQPGMFFSYSNSGPAVAAYVVEKVSGQRYEDFVQEHIFAPLGMLETVFFPNQDILPRLSKSYGLTGAEIPYSHIIIRPSGAVSTTPADMGNLLRFLIERGRFEGQTLLQPESIEILETPHTNLAAEQGLPTGYAKGIFTSLHEGFVFYGHDGGIDGFAASYGYLPEQRAGYYVSLNGSAGSLGPAVDLLSSYLVRNLEIPSPPPPASALASQERFAGYYESFTPRMELLGILERLVSLAQVETTGSGLVFRPLLGGEPQQLIPTSSGALYRGSDDPLPTLAFVENSQHGTVLIAQGGLAGNMRMAPAWSVIGRLILTAAVLLLFVSVLLYALVWIPLWLFRPQKRTPNTGLPRLLPLLAVLALVAAILFLGVGFSVGIEALGMPGVWSIGLFVFTILFALLSLASLILAIRSLRLPEISLPLRLYSLSVSLALLITLVYLAANNFIGIRTWI